MCSAESTPDPNSGSGTGKTQETAIRNPNKRGTNKPIMEKRRRARINNCLNELKSILLEAMRKDPARHSKLEKADILELTVSHLKSLRHQGQASISPLSGSESAARFRAGFADCAAEVGRFLSSSKAEGVDPQTSGRLLNHLADCLNSPAFLGSPVGGLDARLCHSPSSQPPTINVPSNAHSHGPAYISLVPSRLSSGELAFVVPGFNSSNLRAAVASGHPSTTPALTAAMQLHHQPMLSPEVPLELTVSSSCSSSTSSSSSLSPAYPIGGHSFHHQGNHHGMTQYAYMPSGQGQPLALVTPKREREDPDMNCWRPWCSSSQENWLK